MLRSYKTRTGELLDAICHRHYPDIAPSETMPQVLAVNAHLLSQPPVLPEGLEITLPDIAAPEPEAAIELWS